MKNVCLSLLLLVGLSAALGANAQTTSDHCQYVDVYGINGGDGGGSGGFPSPMNCPAGTGPKFELATGEVYILIGRIYIQNGYAYLYVDYAAHPWLANQARRNSPYYLIQGVETSKLLPFHNQIVKVRMQALGQIGRDQKGKPEYFLGLRPLNTPTVIRARQ